MATLNELMNRPFFGKITEGKHSLVLTSWEFVDNSTNPDYSYIKAVFTVDGKNSFTKNLFNRDVTFFLSQTRRQLGREHEDLVPVAYFNELVANKTPLDAWFSYPTVETRNGAREVQNLTFAEPIATTQTKVDDDDLPY